VAQGLAGYQIACRHDHHLLWLLSGQLLSILLLLLLYLAAALVAFRLLCKDSGTQPRVLPHREADLACCRTLLLDLLLSQTRSQGAW
jgi:hypothetical protein